MQRGVEGLHLGEGVLAGVAVDHEQHLVRSAGLRLADHAPDLLQLFHQMRLGRQASGGVGNDDVAIARLGGDDGIEGHAGRIAAFLADDVDAAARPLARRLAGAVRAGPLGPGEELLARRGAEGVGGGEQHLLVRIDEMPGQLADARRLARAVDADDHDDRRPVLADGERPFERREQVLDASREQAPRRGGVAHVGTRHARLQVVEQIARRRGAGVGLQQGGLEVFVQLVADGRADEGFGDGRSRSLQAAPELGKPSGTIGWHLLRLGRTGVGRVTRRLERRRRRRQSVVGRNRLRWHRAGFRLLAEEELTDIGVEPLEGAARAFAGGGLARPVGWRPFPEKAEHEGSGEPGVEAAASGNAKGERREAGRRGSARYTRGLRRFSSVG